MCGYVPFTHQLFNAGWSAAWVGDEAAPDGWFDDYDNSVPEESEVRTTHHATVGNIPPPVFTFVQGHMGSFCAKDIDTLLVVGVNREDVNLLLRDLQKFAIHHLHACVGSFYRTLKRTPSQDAAQQAPHVPLSTAGTQVGVG
jgi:hypothetical protein